MDYFDALSTAENEIRSLIGGEPGPLNITGKINRFATNGKPRDRTGWYVGYRNENDFLVVVAGDWRSGEKHKIIPNKGTGTRTAEHSAFIKKCFEDAEKQREKTQKKATDRAKFIWDKAKPAENHAYLDKKGIKPHGTRLYKGVLIVPVLNDAAEIVSIQFISGDGGKRFLKGGTVAGGRFQIPGEGDPILCEGFATGASIAEATGRTVVVAFNAGNLLKVAEPGMTIGGDNDNFTKDHKTGEPWNPGREKALTAAWEQNCQVVIPVFQNTDSRPTDFNDMHVLENLDAVRQQIDGAVSPQEYLLKELKTDVGACYRPEHLRGLKLLKERNKPAYMQLRAELKRAKGVAITDLEKDLSQIRMDDSEETSDHLSLAKEVIGDYGAENLILHEGLIWKWDQSGVWVVTDPREIKKIINRKVENALSAPTKSIVDSIFDLLKTEIFRPNHQWNADQSAINVLNGELTYTDGKWILQPHCREHYRTTQIPVAYDENATAPETEKYLESCFEDDSDRQEKMILVCELLGYSLLASAKYETFVILIGSGANGKSVLIDLLISLVGSENAAGVQPSKFDSPFQRAYLNHKLVNAVSELAVGEEIKDAQMKAITSGEKITCEHKFKDPFDMQPYCTIWLATNHMPHTRDFSPALFRRARIITFNRTFDDWEQDKNLKSKLQSELSGVLNLALAGIAGVFKRGYFTEPGSCAEAKREWRLHADQSAEFVQDKCIMRSGLEIESGTLYDTYLDWTDSAGIKKKLARNSFTTRICNLGVKRKKGTGGSRLLEGIDLKSKHYGE